jgi:hypothetical protein
MRIFSYLLSILVAVILAACGGGGGSPGLSSGPNPTFSVLAPAAVTLQVGSLQAYAITGGVKPYTQFSSDPAVAIGWISGDDMVYVGTVVAGKATVSVMDAKGSKFDIAVTSGSSTALYTTAASSMTITPGAAFAQTYTIGGGTPPYVATSSFPSVATVAVNGNQMTITGVQISATPSNITIRDAAGATLTVAVTVGTVPLAVNPATLTAPIGVTFRSVITGGTPPYRTVVLDNCSTNAQIIQGNILQATTALPCTGAAITVVDANNQTTAVTFTVTAGTVGLQVAPGTLTIPESTNTPDLQLLVYGANGPLKVFSTNTTMLAPQTPVSNTDGTYTISLTGGNTCSATVVAAIPAVVNGSGVITTPAVPAAGGDRTITITVIDSTGRQGTSTLTIKDTNGVAGC